VSERNKELHIEGIVRASRYSREGQGKQFLGATIECSEGKEWVISYSEQSPYHVFADRRVVASGESYEPEGQRLMSREGTLGHFSVSTMRLLEAATDAPFVEVGAAQELTGRFSRGKSDTGKATLSFATRWRSTFQVINDPAGASVGRRMRVKAYPVQPSPSIQNPRRRYLWVICPCSMTKLWEWRRRQ